MTRRKYLDWLARFLDASIASSLKNEANTYTRAQILAGVILVNIVAAIVSAIGVGFWMNLAPFESLVAYVVIAQCVFFYGLALAFLRIYGSITLSGNLAAFAAFNTVLIGALLTGGYRESPVTQTFILIPVLAFLLVGLKSGVLWSIVAVLTMTSLLILDYFSIFYVQLLRPTDAQAFLRFMPFLTTNMIIFAMLIYEFVNRKLKKQLNRERNRFAFKASHDSLTDLPNREEFYMRLRHSMEEAQLNESSLALIYIDLDGFKPINDTHGHHAGDKVLKIIASRLRSILRQQDTVARLGGDEFALILPGLKHTSDVTPVVEKTLALMGETISLDNATVVVHGSAGVAFYPQDTNSADQLCQLADGAMYHAKEVKNTYRFAKTAPN